MNITSAPRPSFETRQRHGAPLLPTRKKTAELACENSLPTASTGPLISACIADWQASKAAALTDPSKVVLNPSTGAGAIGPVSSTQPERETTEMAVRVKSKVLVKVCPLRLGGSLSGASWLQMRLCRTTRSPDGQESCRSGQTRIKPGIEFQRPRS